MIENHDETDARPEVADFDAFFAEQTRPAPQGVPLRLYGRDYVLPPKLSTIFALQLHRVRDSANPDDIRRLLAALFGPDAVDHWAENGMDDRSFGIVLLWSTANMTQPGSMTMAEAAEAHDAREAAQAPAGKVRPPRPRPKGKGKRPNSGKRS
ncbi:hypothetical protein [Streptomyces antarcticus]|uniref:hypothetical protein n=1 Tax=Streptomyces antarcticus TaxID=2996458 RepID=UPI002270451D|nr:MULTISPECIES: hypothetical protein [unclassified Streptomyces]MCY0942602.1 hypothetical protein [Streptomyces sp. H34-AA3]MCZ4081348.1 hypothetical protein [Streptomyces sp. H34-S5]